MENWIDIGSTDELSATQLKRVTATESSQFLTKIQSLASSQTRAITSADHWAMASSMANTLFARGITGNFIDAVARANLASRTIVFRPTKSKSKTDEF